MGTVPAWIAPTIAISLVIIAASLLTVGVVALAVCFGLRARSRQLSAQITALTADAKSGAGRLKHEVDGFTDISTEARLKLKSAIGAVEGRLQDLDALAEVLQEEVQETALSAATVLRTVRRSGKVLGAARRVLKRRSAEGSD